MGEKQGDRIPQNGDLRAPNGLLETKGIIRGLGGPMC